MHMGTSSFSQRSGGTACRGQNLIGSDELDTDDELGEESDGEDEVEQLLSGSYLEKNKFLHVDVIQMQLKRTFRIS